jgi:hypothetical protein
MCFLRPLCWKEKDRSTTLESPDHPDHPTPATDEHLLSVVEVAKELQVDRRAELRYILDVNHFIPSVWIVHPVASVQHGPASKPDHAKYMFVWPSLVIFSMIVLTSFHENDDV